MDALRDKYIEKWKLSDCQLIEETPTSYVYKATSSFGAVVLKILTNLGIEDEFAGPIFLKNTSGIGAVKLFEYDDRAQLIEYLAGDNLYSFSKINEEPKASKVFVDIIKKIQEVKNIESRDELTPVSDLYKIFDRIETPKALKVLFKKVKELAVNLESGGYPDQ